MRTVHALMVALALSLLALPSHAREVSWGKEALNLGAARDVQALEMTDLDGDGDTDMVFAGKAGGLQWWENRLQEPAVIHRLPVFSGATDLIVVADFDRDGDTDILAQSGIMGLVWLENRLSVGEQFAVHLIDPRPEGSSALHVLDLDGDGAVEVFRILPEGNILSWKQEETHPRMGWRRMVLGLSARPLQTLEISDVDRNGRPDLIVLDLDGGLYWLENPDSAEAPVWKEHAVFPFVKVLRYAVGDFGGNGWPSIMASDANDALLWLENPAGGDQPLWNIRTVAPVFPAPLLMVAADLDGDGDGDLITLSGDSGHLAWWENPGLTVAGEWEFHPVDSGLWKGRFLKSADMDRDGDADLIGVGMAEGGLLWRNLCVETGRTDPEGGGDGDGTPQGRGDLAIPNAPTNLTATAASKTQINLQWTDNSSDETGFKIERSSDSGTTWTQINTVGAGVATYPDTGRLCNATYYYRVRATNGSGDSAYSNVRNAWTFDCFDRGKPVWKVLFLAYKYTDTDYVEGGDTKHMTSTQPDSELYDAMRNFYLTYSKCNQWTSGECVMQADVIIVTARPIQHVSAMSTDNYWAAPEDTHTELDLYAPAGSYDSIFVHWRKCADAGTPCIPSGAFGLGGGPTPAAHGATYLTVTEYSPWPGPPPATVWTHEWIHSQAWIFNNQGWRLSQSNADGGSSHGYSYDSTEGWDKYYRDYWQAMVWEDGGFPDPDAYTGIPGPAWRERSNLNGRYNTKVDYFWADTTASYTKTGTVAWNSTDQNVALGTSTPAANSMVTPIGFSGNFTLMGMVYVPSSGVGTSDTAALVLQDSAGTTYWWAELDYGTGLTKQLRLLRNGAQQSTSALTVDAGYWYHIKLYVDLAADQITMKGWRDFSNEPGSWQITGTLDASWTVDKIGFRHYGQGTRVDDLFAIQPLPTLFNKVTVPFTGLKDATLAWGDYDNDGDLDLAMAGNDGTTKYTIIYRNEGGGAFTDIGASLTGFDKCALAWGDYDNDNDLDLLITGDSPSGATTKLYRNNAGVFSEVTGTGLTNMSLSDAAWGDMDNDGDLDIVIAGWPISARVFTNQGNGAFALAATLACGYNAAVALGDYDNDGDLDIVCSGYSGSVYQSTIYRNDGAGVFTDIGAGLAGMDHGSAAWGDYDNDGDLDLLMTGFMGSTRITQLYQNFGGTFTQQSVSITGTADGNAAFGDYNNDGLLDIVVVGMSSAGVATAVVYLNMGNGRFATVNAGIDPAEWGYAAWGDYDGDGRLDIAVVGSDMASNTAKLYRNVSGAAANTVPTAPTGLSAVVNGTSVTLNWNASSDSQTPAAGLTYNLRVGTTPEALNLMSPMADTSTGFRRLSAMGNAQEGTSAAFTAPLSCGTYYWSVQAVDSAFAGGPFATEGSFTVTTPFCDSGATPQGVKDGSVAWGDYDNDGDLDFMETGDDGSTRYARVYRNDGAGTFTAAANLMGTGQGINVGGAVWGDYDNDGDLDVLLVGYNGLANGRITKLYRNTGGSFAEVAGTGLENVADSAAAFGDYDNDGRLDVVLAGQNPSGTLVTKVFRKNSGDTYTQVASLQGVRDPALAWGDYDNDGDLDLLVTGLNGSTRYAIVYRNDGGGAFTDIGAGLTGVSNSSAVWGDFDNDSDLDILITGYDGSNRVAKLYRNTSGSFAEVSGTGLPGVEHGAAAFGDMDNDGDLDIALSGYTGSANWSRVYRNDGGGVFTDLGTMLPALRDASVAWGDYDNDGKLDILLSGDTGSSKITRIFRNMQAVSANTAPTAPSGLSAVADATTVTFSWSASSDTQTPAGSLTYNLRIGTAAGGSDLYSTMANASTGFRRLPAMGGAQLGTSATVNLPTTGCTIIYWSVQAVDSAFAGGLFAAEGSLEVDTPFCQRASLVGGNYAASAWGDFDNDGDLDLVNCGFPGAVASTKLYRNDGGTFTEVTGTGLANFYWGGAAWGDYDRDGILDLGLNGASSGGIYTRVYHGNGDGTFTQTANLQGTEQGSFAWGDYDSDGDLDILITGTDSVTRYARVYRNDGSGTFTPVADLLGSGQGINTGKGIWGDTDNDGDPDILLVGYNGSARVTTLFKNTAGAFAEVTGTGLENVADSAAAFGDYNNDGLLDIVLAGQNPSGTLAAGVFRNNSNDTFTQVASLQGLRDSSVAWGDYNNDGYPDILLTGLNSVQGIRYSTVYRNNGDGTFTDIGAGMTGVSFSSTSWGDYDNDGDLDAFISGMPSLALLYRNNTTVANAAPASPSGLSATFTGSNEATFSWSAPSDDHTPSGGLTYNLLFGTTLDGVDIVSPAADVSTGYRRIAAMGNAQEVTTAKVGNLPAGCTLYWGVQAVDGALLGGAFAKGTVARPSGDIYVDDDYDSDTPGWNCDHFASIQSGINAVADEGTVYVAEGTYAENVTFDKNASLTFQGAATIQGNFSQGDGAVTAPGATLSVTGNWSRTGGGFTASSGTVAFTGTGAQTVSGTTAFYNLTINNTHASAKVDASSASLTVANLILLQDGIFRTASTFKDVQLDAAGTLELSGDAGVSGNWTDNGGTFTHGGLSVVFNGTGAQTITGTTAFGGITINGGSNLTLSNAITVAANWASSGQLTHNNYLVTFNGNGAQTVSGSTGFYNLTINNSSASAKVDAPSGTVSVSNLLRIQDGIFRTGSSFNNIQLDAAGVLELSANAPVTGNWTDNGGTLVHNGLAIVFNGTGVQTITGATAFGGISIGGSSNLTLSGPLTVAGNWTNSGQLTHNNNLVTFNGSGAQTLSGATSFYNLTINNSSASAKVDASGSTLTVTNLLRLQDGIFKGASSYKDVQLDGAGTLELATDSTVSGNWTDAGGTFTHNLHAINFNGSGTQTITGPTNFGGIAIGASSNLTLANPIFVAGIWTNDGQFTQSGHLVTFNGTSSQLFSGSTLFSDVTVSGGATLQMGQNSTLQVTGTFTLGGSLDSTTTPPNQVMFLGTSSKTVPPATYHHLLLNDGLLGYWKLDDASGTTAADSSGYGHPATLNNSPVWSTDLPVTYFRDPGSLQFNRADADNAYIAGTDSIGALQQLTVAGWVKMTTMPASVVERFVTVLNEKAVLRYDGAQGAGQLHFYMTIGGSVRSIRVNNVLAAGSWFHVAGTYDGTTMHLYLNGTEVGTPVAISGAVGSGNTIRFSSAGTNEALDGYLDEVRVYDHALSAAEVLSLASGTVPDTVQATYTMTGAVTAKGNLDLNSGKLTGQSSLIGYWKGDEGSGTVTRDSSGLGNTGTLRNGALWTASTAPITPPNPYAISFDGVDDDVQIPHNAAFSTPHITVSAWIKADTWTAESWRGCVVGKDESVSGTRGFDLRTGNNGQLSFVIGTASGWKEALTSSLLTTGTWTHVAGTYDGTNVRAYINGVERATTPFTGAILASTCDLLIGRAPYDVAQRRFDGTIDDVRIYSEALTTVQIQAIASGAAIDTYQMNIGGDFNRNGGVFSSGSTTVVLDGAAQQNISGAMTFNNMSVSNPTGALLWSDTTVNGTLALTSGDVNTSARKMVLGSSATASGDYDVVGKTSRPYSLAIGTAYAFGSPYATVNFASGTPPTGMDVLLEKISPSGLSAAVQRQYTITPTGGSGYAATLRLHYRDSELGSVSEGALKLFRNSGSWTDNSRTGIDVTSNWVEKSGIITFSPWALSSSGTAPGGPAEASKTGSPMRASKGSGTTVNVTYTPASCATDHAIYWGSSPISGSLSWNNSTCARGTTGSTSFDPGTPSADSFIYFAIVGNNGTSEGSYGKNSANVERPDALPAYECRPQQLSGACP